MRRIFRENLNLKALKYILSKEKSKLDDESIELAKELIELSWLRSFIYMWVNAILGSAD